MDSHPFMEESLPDSIYAEIEPIDVETRAVVDITTPLNEEEARALTDTIRNAVDVLWALIARAHGGGAWKALGYDTWGDYVAAEFNMSRSRSYQLLDQARVVKEIEAAVPEGTPINITEAAARDLKGMLEEVVPEIRERTAGLDPEDAADVLDEIVAEQRERLREERETQDDDEDYDFGDFSNGPGEGRRRDWRPEPFEDEDADEVDVDLVSIRRAVNAAHDLYSSLSALAGLPSELAEIVDIIPPERYAQVDGNLRLAKANLDKFTELWAARRGDDFYLGDED